MPSLEVPSANSTTAAPPSGRACRSMKIVRCNFASQPNTGQRATSLLATNTTGASADITHMSSQDMVGQDQRGARNRSRPGLANPHADQRAENAMVLGNGPLQPEVECEAINCNGSSTT